MQFVNQKEGQSVQAYYSSLIERTKKLNKTDKELMSMFLQNLRNDYKMVVLSRKPETLEKSYELAREAESLHTIADVALGNELITSLNLPGDLQFRSKQIADPTVMANLPANLQRLNDKVDKIKTDSYG